MSSKTFGYIRVSTEEQNIERQLRKMEALGIAERNIFIDKASGAHFERPAYKALKTQLRDGDLLYVDALDRLGRDYNGIIKEWKYITREVGADIVALDDEGLFDSRRFKAMNVDGCKLGALMEDQFLSLFAYIADRERQKILKHQAEGIAEAKAKGKHLGRPRISLDTMGGHARQAFEVEYIAWKGGKQTAVQTYTNLGMTKTTFYKLVKEMEAEAAGGKTPA